ncbi:hypothetical protein G7Y89_g13891 [Cudoniella acicularis]|uniref:Uncharacterized protein n=1 Tax=Cudoniella acicularis TaxID=354080 RepID=A0A8H4R8T3_9HELO|nr:hypothetical protein G7Y89_g13891 [Cudoniella acicularis]
MNSSSKEKRLPLTDKEAEVAVGLGVKVPGESIAVEQYSATQSVSDPPTDITGESSKQQKDDNASVSSIDLGETIEAAPLAQNNETETETETEYTTPPSSPAPNTVEPPTSASSSETTETENLSHPPYFQPSPPHPPHIEEAVRNTVEKMTSLPFPDPSTFEQQPRVLEDSTYDGVYEDLSQDDFGTPDTYEDFPKYATYEETQDEFLQRQNEEWEENSEMEGSDGDHQDRVGRKLV